MQMIFKRAAAALVLVAASTCAMAQVQYAKGKSSVSYTTWRLSNDDRAKALHDAQIKAIESYYAESGDAASANLEAIRDKVSADPEAFLTDTTVLNEEDNTDQKKYSVAVRVSINTAKLRNTVKAGSAVANTTSGDKSKLTFLFVSRQIDEKKSFDTRVYQREDVNAKVQAAANLDKNSTDGESVRSASVRTNGSKNVNAAASMSASVSTESGGSQTRKASQSTYALIPSENLLTVFKQNFGQAGYKVVEAAYVEPSSGGKLSIAAVENDYATGKDLKPATKRDMVIGVHNAAIPYLAYGTLDAGLADTDPQTGLMRVGVTVNAKIVDASADMPEDIANVGPIVVYGTAPDEEEARTLALKNAATRASRELVSQLTNTGLK